MGHGPLISMDLNQFFEALDAKRCKGGDLVIIIDVPDPDWPKVTDGIVSWIAIHSGVPYRQAGPDWSRPSLFDSHS